MALATAFSASNDSLINRNARLHCQQKPGAIFRGWPAWGSSFFIGQTFLPALAAFIDQAGSVFAAMVRDLVNLAQRAAADTARPTGEASFHFAPILGRMRPRKNFSTAATL